ncbi:MAG: hypothetical protein ACT4QF_17290 [Sporichthyaceae bacterium]
MYVGLWVAIGVLGILFLAVPTLKLWRTVKVLGKEVKRVSSELGAAGAALEEASRKLPGKNGRPLP